MTSSSCVQAVAGLRPGTPDNLPVIGEGDLRGLVWATGHWRNGVLLAPLTGEAVAELLAGGTAAGGGGRARRRALRGGGGDRVTSVTINGEPHRLPADATVAHAVRESGVEPGGRGVAVALDGEVVPRGAWASTTVREGQELEVLHAVQGGDGTCVPDRRSRAPLAPRARHRRLPQPGGDDAGRARLGSGARDGGDAPRRPLGPGLDPRGAGCRRLRGAARTPPAASPPARR